MSQTPSSAASRLPPLVAAILAVTVYANSLDGSFVIDDGSAVRTNQDLRPEMPLSQLLAHDFWGRPIDAAHSVKSYRPLTVLSFRWNFALHGLDVRGYHLTNVLLHAACAALLAPVAAMLAPSEPATVAAVASISFAVHPVHTEAVASIVGRAELLCCLFFLLTLMSYGAGLRAKSNLASGAYVTLAVVLAVLATASKETGITALGVAVCVDLLDRTPPSSPPPPSAPQASQSAPEGSGSANTRLMSLSRVARLSASVLTTATLWIGSRALRGDRISPYFSFVDNPLPSLPGAAARRLSAAHIHVRYARLLLLPAALSADYSYNCVPMVERLGDPRNLSAAILYGILASLVGAGCLAAWAESAPADRRDARHPCLSSSAGRAAPDVRAGEQRAKSVGGGAAEAAAVTAAAEAGEEVAEKEAKQTEAEAEEATAATAAEEAEETEETEEMMQAVARRRRVSSLRCLALLLLPLLPASHVLLGVGTLIGERLLYVPSAGYCILLGLGAAALLDVTRRIRHPALRRSLQRTAAVAAVAVLACGCALTWHRNRDWRDSAAITSATATVCPGSAKAQLSLGTLLLQRGDHSGAHQAFRAALRVHPEYSDALYWLGRLAFMRAPPNEPGALGTAEKLLSAAIHFNQLHPEANLFAALCASRRGDVSRGVDLLGRAHAVAPHNAEIVRDYGAILFRANRTAEAVPLLRRVSAYIASNSRLLTRLGAGTSSQRVVSHPKCGRPWGCWSSSTTSATPRGRRAPPSLRPGSSSPPRSSRATSTPSARYWPAQRRRSSRQWRRRSRAFYSCASARGRRTWIRRLCR